MNAATQVKDALVAAANYIKDAVTHKASEAKEVVEEINNSMGDKNWSRPLLFIKIHKDKEKIYVYLVQG